MLLRLKRALEDPARVKRAIQRRLPSVYNVNNRALSRKVRFRRRPAFRKTFRLPEAEEFLQREVLAREVFSSTSWILPILDQGRSWIDLPLMKDKSRLDIAARSWDRPKKREMACEAASVLLDLHAAGFAHCDFHAQNLFCVKNQLVVCDLEKLSKYDEAQRPPFPEGYDMSPNLAGLELLGDTDAIHMHFGARTGLHKSIEEVLGVSAIEAMELLMVRLRSELLAVCATFRSLEHRHWPRSRKIYSSFSLPLFEVSANEAQRDSTARLRRLGVTASNISNCSVLDLGCNNGGTLFELQKFEPRRSLGVDYDSDKVALANRLAALNGLNSVSFRQADVEEATVESLEGPYDVVFCLALVEHVRAQACLYQLLSEATKSVLFFEGNGSTRPEDVSVALVRAGFSSVEMLGTCDDDRVENNNRPLFVARK